MPSASSKGANVTLLVIVGVVVLLGAAFGLAVLVAGGDDDGAVAAGVEQVRAVTIEGAALPAHDSSAATDAAVGMTAPTLRGASFDGTPVTVTPGDGTPKMLVFLAHWCPHCQREVPVLTKWINDGRAPSGLEIVAVSTGVSSDAPNYPPSAWLAREGWPKSVLADNASSAAGKAYGLTAFPYLVVLDAEGNVVVRTSGELSADQLDQLMALSVR
jgi:thiol-disulfide isomerase/thioredoxin